MAGNSFGTLFKLTTFGESHGPAIGGVLDGCPAGMVLDMDFVRLQLQRRRPGQSVITSPRNEKDEVEILSGVFEGLTLGTPIGFIIRNQDQQSSDYDQLRDVFRPGHADETWLKKFGVRDHRGGGRASARETASRVVGGSIARLLLRKEGINIQAYVSAVKDIEVKTNYRELDLSLIDSNIIRCPEQSTAELMIRCIESAREVGDSVGGVITCVVKGLPAGFGEPVFDKLHAQLGHALLSINAVKGFELEDGFASTKRMGSENNTIPTGIQGGISSGEDIVCRVAFKPVSTITSVQKTRNTKGEEVTLEATGRHDPCVLPRAVVIVESMAALVLADALLLNRTNQ